MLYKGKFLKRKNLNARNKEGSEVRVIRFYSDGDSPEARLSDLG
jgi:hypothetical protein